MPIADENKKDIPISDTESIHWVEFDTLSSDILEVDYIIAKHDSFWKSLEILCVPECCGLDAFSFFPNDIKHASNYVDKEQLENDFLKLKKDLLISEKKIISSSRLNNLIDKNVFIKLLDHIMKSL